MELGDKIKILVAHPGRQHSYQLATAMQRAGMLEAYITTVYNKESSPLMRLVKKVIKGKDKNRAEKRKNAEIPDEKVVQFCELRGLLLLLILRVDKSSKLFNLCNRAIANSFGKKVAKYAIKKNVDAVICYDTNSMSCFTYLKEKAPNIVRIMDNAQANRFYLNYVYGSLREKCGDFEKAFSSNDYIMSIKKANRFCQEARLCDYHIVASSFSQKAVMFCGIEANRIINVPYGVNVTYYTSDRTYSVGTDDKLRVLLVGEVHQRKGIVQFIEAAEQLKEICEFHQVGGGFNTFHDDYYREKYNHLVVYHGYVLPDELKDIYSACDVFLFPVLGEGFGLVLLEAMGAGLPVISSGNCAGPDLIQDGYNGFIVPAGDTNAIIEKIKYFYENRDMVALMGRNASEVAKHFTWDNYYSMMTDSIINMLERA